MVQEGELALTATNEGIPSEISLSPQDTVTAEPEPVYGVVLSPPTPRPSAEERSSGSEGVSYILLGMFLLFLVIALRFRNNMKYAITMLRNLVETRTRQNVFDDTVRETSLIVLLNLMWCVSAGIIGFCVISYLNPSDIPPSSRALGMVAGMIFAGVYALFLWGAYASVGWVFSDKTHAELWVKGFSASQALMTPALFLLALLVISTPHMALQGAIPATFVFILAKLVFIWKGYRIFFNQFSSWVLFLCYLCSLEIVPLILCYRGAVFIIENA